MKVKTLCFSALFGLSVGCVAAQAPEPELSKLPPMRWSHMDGHEAWNEGALEALETHGAPLVSLVPEDIEEWCPAYESADEAERQAFWVGFMSALAKHESTYKPWAVGGGGKWYGLLQILPATARGYGCRANSGAALKDGGDNLSCAIRIMAVTVPRDGVISGRDTKWRGVAADWGPMRSASKRQDIASWVRSQPYCAVPSKTQSVVTRTSNPSLLGDIR